MKTKLNQLDENIGKDIEGFYYLSDFRISSGKKGRYANVMLTDCTGEHTARMWQEAISEDGSIEASLIGKVVHVFGRIDAYDGKGSLIIGSLVEADENQYEMSEIARCLSTEEKSQLVCDLSYYMSRISDRNLSKLVKKILNDNYNDFMSLPAGLKMHHNFNGGLAVHTCEVCSLVEQYLNIMEHFSQFKDYGPGKPDAATKSLAYAGAILHDIGKVEEYKGFPSARISKRGELIGHLGIGTDIIRCASRELEQTDNDYSLEPEMLDELCHIIIASHGDSSYVAPKTLEALIVSFSDDFSAQCDGYGVSLSDDRRINPDDPGEFFYDKRRQRRFLRRKGGTADGGRVSR